MECKDWKDYQFAQIKASLDGFITKVKEVNATHGVFVVNYTDTEGRFNPYKEYLRKYNLLFWDKRDIDLWHELITKDIDRIEYQKQLCNALGISISDPSLKNQIG